jgi:hypothetical protein
MRALKRLSYANVMSTFAVFAVLGGGTAFAATQLAKNSVGTKQIKSGAVTAAKIKNGAVTGAKVDLASLGTVPSAANAANASTVGGQTVTKVFTKIQRNQTVTVATFGPFKIVAGCEPNGTFGVFELDPQTTDTDVFAFGDGDLGGPYKERNQGSEPNSISLRGKESWEVPRGIVTFSASQAGGYVATGTLSFNDSETFGGEETCAVYGEVVSS